MHPDEDVVLLPLPHLKHALIPQPCPHLLTYPYLLQRLCSLLPSCPGDLQPLPVINFHTVSISCLHPAGAIVGGFHASPLLSGITFSCKIVHIHLSCPLTPLCSLYITSYLNSQLFSWLNKPRTSYSKVIRVLLESYVTTWLFWSPFTSPLPADKGLAFLFIYVNSLFYWAGILSAISALRQSHSAGSVLCVIWLCFLSLLWQAHCEV